MECTIRLTDTRDEAVRGAILAPLVAYNRAKTGRDDARTLVLTLEDSAQQVIGGLWGRTAYDWLFVPESMRGTRYFFRKSLSPTA